MFRKRSLNKLTLGISEIRISTVTLYIPRITISYRRDNAGILNYDEQSLSSTIMTNFLSMNLKMTVERSKRRSYFLSLVFITKFFNKNLLQSKIQLKTPERQK